MTSPPLSHLKACVFDAYGTLFDVHAAAARCRDDLGPQADELSRLWRQKQLEYTWLRSLMGAYEDFWQVTGEALSFALENCGLQDPARHQRLMTLYLELDAYPEVHATLEALKAAGVRTAILSNGSPPMLDAAVNNAGLKPLLDTVLSVDELRIYKPHPQVYQLAVDSLGCAASDIGFLSSNTWDTRGAAHFGLTTIWVNRFGQKADVLPGTLAAEITRLDQLPPLMS